MAGPSDARVALVAAFAARAARCLLGSALLLGELPSAFAHQGWEGAERLGGDLTVYSFGSSPFVRPAPFLSLETRVAFSQGSVAFRQPQQPPSAQRRTARNAASCEACHFQNGRGRSHLALLEGSGFSVVSLPSERPVFREHSHDSAPGATLQQVVWRVEREVVLSDQTHVELVTPVAIVDGVETAVDLRTAPAVHGLGLLEAIPEADIRALANARAASTSSSGGVVGTSSTNGRVGRFGWKGRFASLDDQVANAMTDELGITDSAERAPLEHSLANYMRWLAVPARRLDGDKQHRGAEIFSRIGCAVCHQPTWKTGGEATVPPGLRLQTIHPFTDLLLHDMGEGLRDARNDALSRMWRTPPLWGLGVQVAVSDKAGLLHDGRARTLDEAILWHGGEATSAMRRFKHLAPDQRLALREFLSSL